ncbi:MAG: type III-B CRISPR-associated protein Cas10/Cmr2 [Chromatiaceae bacterium]|nr:MAG: type III-B CRISPR-associated protein Cas10/Cmr2 [Chromatiaceae bacterium]
MDEQHLWQTKLAARVHDPIEKALVLLRDPAGHEGGTVRQLRGALGLDRGADDALAPAGRDDLVRRADWWAAAADRPQWPLQAITTSGGRALAVAPWAQVRWTNAPVLIHPLSGAEFDLAAHGGLADTELADLKRRSLDHLTGLIVRNAQGQVDARRTLLAYWRFGPDLREDDGFGKLGALWRLLPADTRVPDHSIWDHLDLASAFAGAFAADPDGEAALLALAIGPVQPFIAAARSTSDLWAGSHLLARLAWEAMRPVCEQLGPDAILFPRLRAVPQVDLWLRDECALPQDWFADCEWATGGGTDSNPLFAAALPNRFVAVVPRAGAEALARTIETRVRDWLQALGRQVCDRLLAAAGDASDAQPFCQGQMRDQLAGFPEVHWAAVPFSLIRPRNAAAQTDLDTTALSAAMAPFFGVGADEPAGFLASPAWQVLQREVAWADGTRFFAPNPGVLYPAVYDLAERVLAAAKTVRPFAQTTQRGWRCSLTGETEWLTTDPAQLLHSYRQQTDTLWTRIAARRPAWAKPGEHLGALPAIKRLWPTLFAEQVEQAVGGQVNRFVVSTHTMALARQLDHWLEAGGHLDAAARQALDRLGIEPVALPRRLLRRHRDAPAAIADAKRLAGLLERAAELDDTDAEQAEALRRLVRATLVPGKGRLETYYALLLFDGDRLGAWLSDQPPHALRYCDGFHPQVRQGLLERARANPRLAAYAEATRALSPGRHLAISGALNDFALTLAREVIESEFLGRVLYAGGDDVLAMLPVADLLPAMQRLRQAYRGDDPEHVAGDRDGLVLRDGFALLRGRLLRLMGTRATASAGAVIAHHQAPLGAVLRELRAAEQRAKADPATGGGGRNAFSLTLIKRSGGSLRFTAHWGEPLAVLIALRDFLAEPAVSRRAVYNSLEWLKDLPAPSGDGAMLAQLLDYQLARQTENRSVLAYHDVPGLARRLTRLALAQPKDPLGWLTNGLAVAEFLARAGRSMVAATDLGHSRSH